MSSDEHFEPASGLVPRHRRFCLRLQNDIEKGLNYGGKVDQIGSTNGRYHHEPVESCCTSCRGNGRNVGIAELGAEPLTAEQLLGVENDPNSPVGITLTLKDCSLKDGVRMRVEMENKGAEPYTLRVCPAMLLCCVKGLHPMIAFDETGMGLLDVCKAQKPGDHEVFLPSQTSFAFDLLIPPDRLPEAGRKAGKGLKVFLAYELGNQKLVHSNVVQAALK